MDQGLQRRLPWAPPAVFVGEVQRALEPAGAEVGQCGPEIEILGPVPPLDEVGVLFVEFGQAGEVDPGIRCEVTDHGDGVGDA